MKLAIRYGEKAGVCRKVKLGSGLVGYAALHREPVLVPDVSVDPRYIPVVDDCRSELAIPMLLKDRCIGVFDLESPELNAFNKEHMEILTLLASQAAVAIENARLYETFGSTSCASRSELRSRSACRRRCCRRRAAQAAQGRRRRGAIRAGARARRRPPRLPRRPKPNSLVVAVGDVSGKGVPAALYSAFAGELVRSRTFRRRYTPERTTPRRRAGVDEHDSPRAPARGVLLHAELCVVRLETPHRRRWPTPRCRIRFAWGSGEHASRSSCPGVPLGSFAGSTYDEVTFDLAAGRRLRVLHGRRVGGVRRRRRGVRDAIGCCEVVEAQPAAERTRDGGRHLRGGRGVSRRAARRATT